MGIRKFLEFTFPLVQDSPYGPSEDASGMSKTINVGSMYQKINYKDLNDTCVAVDTMGIIYSSVMALGENQLTDLNDNITTHIQVTLATIRKFHRNGASQIWVFDNPNPNKMKAEETERRRKARNRLNVEVTPEMIEEIKLLLGYIGIPYLVAPEGVEAEFYAGMLTHSHEVEGEVVDAICDYVYTRDTDAFLFAKAILRTECRILEGKKFRTIRANNNNLFLYVPEEIKTYGGLTDHEVKMVAIALGNDFDDKGIYRVGPKTALRKIRRIKLEDLDAKKQKIYDYLSVRYEAPYDLSQSEGDYEKLSKFLSGRHFGESSYSFAKTN